ncbi:SLC38A11 (predicted) [Pycnogonum litorale]
MISYNVIIGDNITKVFVRLFQVSADSIISNRNFVVVLTTILVTLPLSLFRNIARLAKASILSVLLQIAILISMLIRWVDMSNIVPATSSDWKFANYGISEAVGILAFAFLCHHNSFLLYQSLENPTEKRWGKVVHISLICSGITAGVFAIIGYSTFRNSTQGDVLENYCFNDDLMNSVRAMFAVTIMLTYPIECFVTRTVLENSIFSNMQPQPVGRHLAETFTIVFITVVLSMTTDCLGVVLEFNGLITALPLAFILPFLSYIRVEEGNLLTRKKILPLFFCSLAIVTMIFGIIWGIYKYSVYGIQCSHGVEMPYCQKELSSNVSFVFSTTQSTTIRIST